MLTSADTAFSIAAVRAEESDIPESERLFEDPYAHLFREAGAHAEEGTQRYLGLPYFREGVRLRTRWLDDEVRSALAAGIGQLVLLGAGFDMRGTRLAASAKTFEVDFPVQLERKRAVLDRARIAISSAYVPFDFDRADFEDALPKALESNGFRLGAGAIFVWEGVIGYIDRPMIDRSLRVMAKAGGPDTRVAFTFGEGSFDPDTAESVTKAAGFETCEELDLGVVWRRHFPGDPPPNLVISKVGCARVARVG
jgi:methyltransferase (TIGR00027 family)